MTSGLAKRMRLRSAKFQRMLRPNMNFKSEVGTVTFESLPTHLTRFYNNEFDEMPCKLDSTEYAHLFRTRHNPALSCGFATQENKKRKEKKKKGEMMHLVQ